MPGNFFRQISGFVQDVKDGSFLIMERQQNVLLWNDTIYAKTKSGKTLKKAQQRLFQEADRVSRISTYAVNGDVYDVSENQEKYENKRL